MDWLQTIFLISFLCRYKVHIDKLLFVKTGGERKDGVHSTSRVRENQPDERISGREAELSARQSQTGATVPLRHQLLDGFLTLILVSPGLHLPLIFSPCTVANQLSQHKLCFWAVLNLPPTVRAASTQVLALYDRLCLGFIFLNVHSACSSHHGGCCFM